MSADYMTADEREQLNSLLAKQKRIARAQKKDARFLSEVDARKEEILERWGISDRGAGEYPMP